MKLIQTTNQMVIDTHDALAIDLEGKKNPGVRDQGNRMRAEFPIR